MTTQAQLQTGEVRHGMANGTRRSDSPSSLDSSSTIDHLFSKAQSQGQNMLHAVLAPEDQQSLSATLRAFVIAHPALCVFVASNIAITGVPLLLFVVFASSVALSSFAIAFFASLVAASFVTVPCVAFALALLLPTICFTTFIASCLAFWIVAGYYVLQWILGPAPGTPNDSTPPVQSVDKPLDSDAGRWPNEFRKIVDTSANSHD